MLPPLMTDEEKELLRKLVHDDNAVVTYTPYDALGALPPWFVRSIDLSDPDPTKHRAICGQRTVNLYNASLWNFKQVVPIKLEK